MANFTYFDTAYNASLTYSNGNRTLQNTHSLGLIGRIVSPTIAGKYYCELVVGTAATSNSGFRFGVATSAYTSTTGNLSTSSSAVWTVRANTGDVYHDNIELVAPTSRLAMSGNGNGEVYQIAFDADTGELWFGMNNTWVGVPYNGTGEVDNTVDSSVYVVVSLNNDVGQEWTGNFDPADWVHVPPAGFGQPWPTALADTARMGIAIVGRGTGYIGVASATTRAAIAIAGRGTGSVGSTGTPLGSADNNIRLPLLRASGTGSASGVIGAAITLPGLRVVGHGAGEAGIRLPSIQIGAQGAGGALGSAQIVLPAVRSTLSGSVAGLAEGAAILPGLAVDASGAAGSISNAALALPLLRAAGVMHAQGTGSVALVLPGPALAGVGAGGNAGTAALELALPRLLAAMGPLLASTQVVAFNTEVLAPTRYTGLPFTALAELGGRVYAAGPAGLYLLEGADDDGADIVATFLMGNDDFNSEYLKRATNLYLGYETDGVLEVLVNVDGGASYAYEVDRDKLSAGDRGARGPFGKGLRSRYWQVGLRNKDGADFTIDEFGLTLAPTHRKS